MSCKNEAKPNLKNLGDDHWLLKIVYDLTLTLAVQTTAFYILYSNLLLHFVHFVYRQTNKLHCGAAVIRHTSIPPVSFQDCQLTA